MPFPQALYGEASGFQSVDHRNRKAFADGGYADKPAVEAAEWNGRFAFDLPPAKCS